MNTKNRTGSALAFALALALAGCGGGGTSGDAATGGVDPALVGTWFEQVTTGADNQTETITFTAAGVVSAVHSQLNQNTTDHAGCTDAVTEMGTFTTSADHTTMTTVATSSTQAFSGCTNPADNGSGPYTGTGLFLSPTATLLTYTISGNTLTLPLGVTLTRR